MLPLGEGRRRGIGVIDNPATESPLRTFEIHSVWRIVQPPSVWKKEWEWKEPIDV
jgi:hypothetical protein